MDTSQPDERVYYERAMANLRKLLRADPRTHREISGMLGWTMQHYRDKLYRKRGYSLGQVWMICDILDYDINDVFC